MDFRELPGSSETHPTNQPSINKEIKKEGKGLGHDEIVRQSSHERKEQKLFEKAIREPSTDSVSLALEESNEILKNYETGKLDEKLFNAAIETTLKALESGELSLKDIPLYSMDSLETLSSKSQGNNNSLIVLGKLLKSFQNDGEFAQIKKIRLEDIPTPILKDFLEELYNLNDLHPNDVNMAVNELFYKCDSILRNKIFQEENKINSILYMTMNLRLGGKEGFRFIDMEPFETLENYSLDWLEKMERLGENTSVIGDIKFLNELKTDFFSKSTNTNKINEKIERLNEIKKENSNSVLIKSLEELANSVNLEGGTDLSFHLIANALLSQKEGDTLGVENFIKYPPELIDKLLHYPGLPKQAKEVLTLSNLIKKMEITELEQFLQKEDLAISTLQGAYNVLEFEPLLNELEKKIYDKFLVQIYEHDPNSDEFEENFKKLSDKTIKICLPKFLKEVFIKEKQYKEDSGIYYDPEEKLIFKQTRKLDLYKACIKETIYKFPEINDDYISDLIFTPKSVDLLIENLKNKENSPFSKVNYQSFALEFENEKIASAFSHIDLTQDQQFEWIVKYPYKPHMSPLHIRVKDGKMDIIVTDSLGNGKKGELLNAFSENMSHILSLVPNSKNISVHWVNLPRQVDASNCPTLSIADMKEFINHPELFDEIIKMKKTSNHLISGDAWIVEEMPVRLLSYIQSVTGLDNKLKTLNIELEVGGSEEHLKKVKEDIQLIGQMKAKSVKKGKIVKSEDEKMLNVFALERYRKYEAIVVSQLFESVLSRGLQESIQ